MMIATDTSRATSVVVITARTSLLRIERRWVMRPPAPAGKASEPKEAEDSLKWSDFVERRDYTGALAVLEFEQVSGLLMGASVMTMAL